MSLPVAILAGGLARRLGAVAERVPKALVEVAGRPFAEHQLALLRAHGLVDIVFLVGHLGDQIRDTLGDGRRLGVRLRYVFDGPSPLGTGGAIRRALPELGPRFFVLYGDSYLVCRYGAVEQAFLASGRRGLMTVYRNENRFDTSNVMYVDGRIRAYDKVARTPEMRHIDYGLTAFERSVFDEMPEGEAFDLSVVCQRLVAADDLAGYEVTERFYEIGSVAGLAETRALLEAKGAGEQ